MAERSLSKLSRLVAVAPTHAAATILLLKTSHPNTQLVCGSKPVEISAAADVQALPNQYRPVSCVVLRCRRRETQLDVPQPLSASIARRSGSRCSS